MASIPKVKNERWDVAWRGFAPGSWQSRVNVREFIVKILFVDIVPALFK